MARLWLKLWCFEQGAQARQADSGAADAPCGSRAQHELAPTQCAGSLTALPVARCLHLCFMDATQALAVGCSARFLCKARTPELCLLGKQFINQALACCAACNRGVLVSVLIWPLRGARCEWQQLLQQRDEALKQQQRLEASRNELARQQGQFKGLIAKANPKIVLVDTVYVQLITSELSQPQHGG